MSLSAPANPERITHRHIEVFRAVMLTGSVTAAADMLFTSQPTVSRELARLEQLLGYELFVRAKGRLRPNERALRLWEEVQRSWQGLDRVVEHAIALGQMRQLSLSVLCMPALSHALMPQALAYMQRLHGEIAVSMTTQDGPLLDEWMSAQRFDLGLTESEVAPPGTRAIALPAMDEVAVLPAHHPLAEKKELDARDFQGQPFISLARDDVYRLQIDRVFEQAQVQRQLLLETHSAAAVCAMVSQGLGVAIVNPFTAKACANQHMVLRPLCFSIPFHVHILLPLHRPQVPEIAWLVEAIEQVSAQAAQTRH